MNAGAAWILATLSIVIPGWAYLEVCGHRAQRRARVTVGPPASTPLPAHGGPQACQVMASGQSVEAEDEHAPHWAY